MYAILVAYTHHIDNNATLETNICKHMLNSDFCIRQRQVNRVECISKSTLYPFRVFKILERCVLYPQI